MQKILLNIASFHDVALPKQESFYHGLILGLIVSLQEYYTIQSNRESGFGFFDVACLPKQTGLAGVLLEFKAMDSEQSLEKGADEALRQINEKKYDICFSECKVTTVWKYGVAFYNKHVLLKRYSDK